MDVIFLFKSASNRGFIILVLTINYTMNSRNVIGAIMTTIMSGFMEFIEPLKWFLLLGFFLIIADLRFGIAASRKRGEQIRASRAGRRTINKMIDYICWILVAGAIGRAFGSSFNMTMLPAMTLIVVFGLEINSLFSNYCEAKGKKIKINVFKLLKKTDIIDESNNKK